jgi:hypothetical protein
MGKRKANMNDAGCHILVVYMLMNISNNFNYFVCDDAGLLHYCT